MKKSNFEKKTKKKKKRLDIKTRYLKKKLNDPGQCSIKIRY